MKCRIFMLHKKTNPGKVQRLEDLHREYVAYVRECVGLLLEARVYTLPKSAFQSFFPKATFTSQIQKNARAHAVSFVSTWSRGVYAQKIKPTITNLLEEGDLTDEEAEALCIIGKHQISKPWKIITQEHLDAYYELLDTYGGSKPQVRSKLPMRLSMDTAGLEDPEKATSVGDFWLASFSTLEYRKVMSLPLVGNPYVKRASDVSKGIAARKTKLGRWRFEAVDRSVWEVPEPSENARKLGIDVGLNVLATSSDGTLYGAHIKPKFDKLYARLRKLRANRQRQGLKENSPKLNKFESSLTGFVKTETGRIANQLIRSNPDTIFVLEDLDLSGCRGQKRFAYRALQTNLERKVPTQKINPAYTSQECPSCGHVARGNRSGTKFTCKSCGLQAHADWVGSVNIQRRSLDSVIGQTDHPRRVKRVLRERYRSRRNRRDGYSSSGVG